MLFKRNLDVLNSARQNDLNYLQMRVKTSSM